MHFWTVFGVQYQRICLWCVSSERKYLPAQMQESLQNMNRFGKGRGFLHLKANILPILVYEKYQNWKKNPLLLDKLHLVCISVLTLQYHLHHVHSLEEVLVDHLWSPHLCHTSGILWDHQWYHLDLLVGPICDRIDGLKVSNKRIQIWLIMQNTKQ